MPWIKRTVRQLLCKAIGCRVARTQRGMGLLVCRDCGRAVRVDA